MKTTRRADKYLADLGFGTRSEVRRLIRSGSVTTGDGQPVTDPAQQIPAGDFFLAVDGIPCPYVPFEYYMLNKPAGVLSASRDHSRTTVVDLIDTAKRHDLFPVGRLDADTTGLLLITNDGALAHRLLSPRWKVSKCYEASIRGSVSEAMLRAFREGVREASGEQFAPAVLTPLTADEESSTSLVHVVLTEGRYHEVKRMFAACGSEVLTLKRLSMGPLVLDPALPEGSFRALTEQEISALKLSGKDLE